MKVDARVKGQEAILMVEQETLESTDLDFGVEDMDLEYSMLYFAGVPATQKGYLQL